MYVTCLLSQLKWNKNHLSWIMSFLLQTCQWPPFSSEQDQSPYNQSHQWSGPIGCLTLVFASAVCWASNMATSEPGPAGPSPRSPLSMQHLCSSSLYLLETNACGLSLSPCLTVGLPPSPTSLLPLKLHIFSSTLTLTYFNYYRSSLSPLECLLQGRASLPLFSWLYHQCWKSDLHIVGGQQVFVEWVC